MWIVSDSSVRVSQDGIEVATRALSGREKAEFPPPVLSRFLRLSRESSLSRDQKFATHITLTVLELPYMYTAQIAGGLPSDEEYLGEDTFGIAPKLAKELAILTHGWGEGQLDDEGIEILATSLAELDIPSGKESTRTPPPVAEFARCMLAPQEVRYAMAPEQLMGSDSPSTQKSVKFTEVDIPTVLNCRPHLQHVATAYFPRRRWRTRSPKTCLKREGRPLLILRFAYARR